MFTYVRLKNFKSFGDVTFDLRDKHGKPKKLTIVYGENGIGKSNLSSSFYLLTETFHTMNVRDILQSFLNNSRNEIPGDDFLAFLKSRFRDLAGLIQENKMAQSEGNLYLEFGFLLEGKTGKYILEMDNQGIVYESMEYLLSKRRGMYFEISPKHVFLSDKVFLDKGLTSNLQTLISQFWGKHSFMSILLYDIMDKSRSYYEGKLSHAFHKVINFMMSISCKVKYGSTLEQGVLGTNEFGITSSFVNGEIQLEREMDLDRNEYLLKCFLTGINRDIKDVYYKKKRTERSIKYHLYIKKLIFGKERELDFSLESTGTQRIVRLLPYMLEAAMGNTVIIDEFDLGIHDVLVQHIIWELYKCIKGQLIITSHNTLLMESCSESGKPGKQRLPAECFYVIRELDDGGKTIDCILKYDNKIGPNTNMRSQFLMGKYHGIPEKIQLDIGRLVEILSEWRD